MSQKEPNLVSGSPADCLENDVLIKPDFHRAVSFYSLGRHNDMGGVGGRWMFSGNVLQKRIELFVSVP